MFIDMKEIERIGGVRNGHNRDIAHALRILSDNDLLIQCKEGDRCKCGGDTPEVRATCSNFVKL